MTDIFDLPEPPVAAPITPAPAENGPVNGRRKRSPPRRGIRHPENGTAPAPARRPGRPKRDPAAAPAATGGMKIDLGVAMKTFAYLKEEDLALTAKIVQALSGSSKSSRARILEALGKVFA
jgi:hypothetical protein